MSLSVVYKHHYIPVFMVSVHFFIGSPAEIKAHKKAKRSGFLQNHNKEFAGVAFPATYSNAYFAINSDECKTFEYALSTLVHELMHILQYICEEKGIGNSEKEAEPSAYLYQYMFDVFYPILKKHYNA